MKPDEKIIIPILQQYTAMAAQSIVGVEPMLTDFTVKVTWDNGFDADDQSGLPYWVQVPFEPHKLFRNNAVSLVTEVRRWLEDTYPDVHWIHVGSKFYFPDERMVTAVLLRWS